MTEQTVSMGVSVAVDNVTLQKSAANVLSIKTGGVDTAQLGYSSVSGNRCQPKTMTARELDAEFLIPKDADTLVNLHSNLPEQTEAGDQSDTWETIKQIDVSDIPTGDTVDIILAADTKVTSSAFSFRFAKNGVIVGGAWTHAAYTTDTQVFTGVENGDHLQVQINNRSGWGACTYYAKNMYVKAVKTTGIVPDFASADP